MHRAATSAAKVRRFAERVYGEDRLLYPAVRKGAKGEGVFTRVTWDEALDLIAERMSAIRDRTGAEAILPFCYGGSNGLLTQDTNDAALFRGVRHVAARAHGVRGADRRGQPWRSTARCRASPTRTTSTRG